jgi:hypothetical protein
VAADVLGSIADWFFWGMFLISAYWFLWFKIQSEVIMAVIMLVVVVVMVLSLRLSRHHRQWWLPLNPKP